MDYQYQMDLPYPPVAVSGVNAQYADMMLCNLGGRGSEMSAVGLYFYNSVVLGDDPALSRIFHKISVVEMRHLDTFARLAQALGADPRLWARQRGKLAYWTPGYTKHYRSVKQILQQSLNAEQAAIAQYRQQIKMIDDKGITACLARIIADEELHVGIFQHLLGEAGSGGK